MAHNNRSDRKHDVTKVIHESLDNVQRLIDNGSDELSKTDLLGANRRLATHLIDQTRDIVDNVAEAVDQREPVSATKNLTVGLVDTARSLVHEAAEEQKRIKLIDTGAKLAEEGLDFIGRQLALFFDAGADLGTAIGNATERAGERLNRSVRDTVREAEKRPGNVTRVAIETDEDKGTVKAEKTETTSTKK